MFREDFPGMSKEKIMKRLPEFKVLRSVTAIVSNKQ